MIMLEIIVGIGLLVTHYLAFRIGWKAHKHLG